MAVNGVSLASCDDAELVELLRERSAIFSVRIKKLENPSFRAMNITKSAISIEKAIEKESSFESSSPLFMPIEAESSLSKKLVTGSSAENNDNQRNIAINVIENSNVLWDVFRDRIMRRLGCRRDGGKMGVQGRFVDDAELEQEEPRQKLGHGEILGQTFLVRSVDPGAWGSRMDIQPGDCVRAVDGQNLGSEGLTPMQATSLLQETHGRWLVRRAIDPVIVAIEKVFGVRPTTRNEYSLSLDPNAAAAAGQKPALEVVNDADEAAAAEMGVRYHKV